MDDGGGLITEAVKLSFGCLEQDIADAILRSVNGSRNPGESWCLISRSWFEDWSAVYCKINNDGTPSNDIPAENANVDNATLGESVEGKETETAENETNIDSVPTTPNRVVEGEPEKSPVKLGPIDNSVLTISSTNSVSLKHNLMEGNDYIAVPEEKYDILEKCYGGGPKLLRRTVQVSKSSKTCVLELYPLQLHECVCKFDKEFSRENITTTSRYTTVKELYAATSARLAVAIECLRVWIKLRPGDPVELHKKPRSVCLQLTSDVVSVDCCGWKWLEAKDDVLLDELAVQYSIPDRPHSIQLLFEIGHRNQAGAAGTITWPRAEEFSSWRQCLFAGDRIDVCDKDKKWWESRVEKVETDKQRVRVHFRGWGANFDESLNVQDAAIQPLYSHYSNWRQNITVNSFLDICIPENTGKRKWYPCRVAELGFGDESGCIKVCVKGFSSQMMETRIISTDDEIIMPLHTHTKPEACKAVLADLTAIDVTRPATFDQYLTNAEGSASSDDWQTVSKNKASSLVGGRSNGRTSSPYVSVSGASTMVRTPSSFNYEAGVVGLDNLGNTCYSNSVMQCLNSLDALNEYFVRGQFRNDLMRGNSAGTRGQLADAYFRFLQNCWSGKHSVINNREVLNAVGLKKPAFLTREQHDAQEFLYELVDLLHEDTNEGSSRRHAYVELGNGQQSMVELADAYLSTHLDRHSSFVHSLFSAQFCTRLQCGAPRCGRDRHTFEVFTILQLPIPRSGRTTLQQCLQTFITPTVLSQQESWKCSHCRVASPPRSTMSFWSLPPVLVIQLKRYYVEQTRWGHTRGKIDTSVDYPLEALDLNPYVAPESPVYGQVALYDLCAVSVQMGSLGAGHYVAYAKHAKTQQWHYFNDRSCSPCRSTEAQAIGEGAYLLFYVRRDNSN